MTQRQISSRIRKFQNAEANGLTTKLEFEALIEGLAKVMGR
jgi:hypothetical protein